MGTTVVKIPASDTDKDAVGICVGYFIRNKPRNTSVTVTSRTPPATVTRTIAVVFERAGVVIASSRAANKWLVGDRHLYWANH